MGRGIEKTAIFRKEEEKLIMHHFTYVPLIFFQIEGLKYFLTVFL
jgi:hypothetical protein